MFQAQFLSGPITTVEKLLLNSNTNHSFNNSDKTNHKLIIISENNSSGTTTNDTGGKKDIKLLGYIKYSYKHLYMYLKNGKIVECDPLCILDFYILETHQRHGFGKLLFDTVLRIESSENIPLVLKYYQENNYPPPIHSATNATTTTTTSSTNELILLNSLVNPAKCAYDRPSPKLISFLEKHYSLCNHELQPNKYMIYTDFFI